MKFLTNTSRRRFFVVIILLISDCRFTNAAEPKLLPQKLLDEGWIQLFDGETLFGWQPTGAAKWQVVNGTIHASGETAGFLMTTSEFADFELYFEFNAPTTTNSGVFLRTPLEPKDPKLDCYELNIAPADNPFPTGSFVGRQKSLATQVPAAGQWHTCTVKVEKAVSTVTIDDQAVLNYTDQSPLRIGHIGLQSREGEVSFRNIRLRPLGLNTIFNGRDLTGWTTAGAEQSKFDVTNLSELRVTNGPGQIATDATFANFVLQAECFVNGTGLNSGFFFRALPTGRWQGYESQINNRFKDDDRTKPADFGTGGIYRRQPARRIVADDNVWFANTIVADGPHMAVWVNGLQVTDWTDKRPPKENAREGYRAGPGTIAIQGHDATTNFLFRNMRIVELPR